VPGGSDDFQVLTPPILGIIDVQEIRREDGSQSMKYLYFEIGWSEG
jgi:hypothetical protein